MRVVGCRTMTFFAIRVCRLMIFVAYEVCPFAALWPLLLLGFSGLSFTRFGTVPKKSENNAITIKDCISARTGSPNNKPQLFGTVPISGSVLRVATGKGRKKYKKWHLKNSFQEYVQKIYYPQIKLLQRHKNTNLTENKTNQT